MPFAELSGLVAALCWTVSSLMAPGLIQRFGTMRFNTFRIVIASSILVLICLVTQRFNATLWQHAEVIVLLVMGIFAIRRDANTGFASSSHTNVHVDSLSEHAENRRFALSEITFN
ncbi:DMT family transporter, partial [Marinomonas pontica]|uniref:EamA family transporter n=1 Tax=Marinomonas pontica TaxID=264739 RepID=UPI002243CBD6